MNPSTVKRTLRAVARMFRFHPRPPVEPTTWATGPVYGGEPPTRAAVRTTSNEPASRYVSFPPFNRDPAQEDSLATPSETDETIPLVSWRTGTPLSAGAADALRKDGIYTVENLVTLTRYNLLSLRGFGSSALADVESLLSHIGLSLREVEPLQDSLTPGRTPPEPGPEGVPPGVPSDLRKRLIRAGYDQARRGKARPGANPAEPMALMDEGAAGSLPPPADADDL